MESLLFVNFTDEDFTWKFDGVPYNFPKGQSIYMEESKVRHFAKHLVNREMMKDGKDDLMTGREVYEAKCIVSQPVPEKLKDMPEDVVVANQNAEVKKEVKVTASELKALAENLGITYDKRWGIDKMKEVLKDHKASEVKTEEDSFEGK
jgi:hypothetical protein